MKELVVNTHKVAQRLADVITEPGTNAQLLGELAIAYEATVRRILILEKLTTKGEDEQVQ